MCSIYSLRTPPAELRILMNYINETVFPPREYVTPGSPQMIVRNNLQGQRETALVRWGFVPSWAKEILPGKPQVNARAETVYEKASFKNAIRRRRCLIPADGFYEWQGDMPGRKQAWHIHRPDHAGFALGGIYERWLSPDGSELESAAILTTVSGLPVAAIHERSPVVVMPEDYERWLSADEHVQDLLKPPSDDYWTMEKTIIARPKRAEAPAAPPQPKPQMDLF